MACDCSTASMLRSDFWLDHMRCVKNSYCGLVTDVAAGGFQAPLQKIKSRPPLGNLLLACFAVVAQSEAAGWLAARRAADRRGRV
jgi:hypothetical protein